MNDQPSEGVLDQRLRNRAIEALEVLAEGDKGVQAVGNVDYVNYFFDTIDDAAPWDWPDVSTLTPAEVQQLDGLQQLLLQAVAATAQVCSDNEFIASGWPERIKPVAADVLALMRRRGLFREDAEEDRPSN